MSVNPGIVRGENVKPGGMNEELTLFLQSPKETRNIIKKFLKISERDPELAGKLKVMILGDEIKKAKEIIKATDI